MIEEVNVWFVNETLFCIELIHLVHIKSLNDSLEGNIICEYCKFKIFFAREETSHPTLNSKYKGQSDDYRGSAPD